MFTRVFVFGLCEKAVTVRKGTMVREMMTREVCCNTWYVRPRY